MFLYLRFYSYTHKILLRTPSFPRTPKASCIYLDSNSLSLHLFMNAPACPRLSHPLLDFTFRRFSCSASPLAIGPPPDITLKSRTPTIHQQKMEAGVSDIIGEDREIKVNILSSCFYGRGPRSISSAWPSFKQMMLFHLCSEFLQRKRLVICEPNYIVDSLALVAPSESSAPAVMVMVMMMVMMMMEWEARWHLDRTIDLARVPELAEAVLGIAQPATTDRVQLLTRILPQN